MPLHSQQIRVEALKPLVDKRKIWTHFPFSFHLINTRKQKDKNLDSPSLLVSFSCTRNQQKNSSTRQTSLIRVTNIGADAHKSLDDKTLPLTVWDFSRSNKHCINLSTAKAIYFFGFVSQCLHLYQLRFPILILYVIQPAAET